MCTWLSDTTRELARVLGDGVSNPSSHPVAEDQLEAECSKAVNVPAMPAAV
jgi:hypothetical protein